MRELICWDMITLDGYFQGPDADLSWFHFDDELERYVSDTQHSAGALLFGRVTYEMMADHWPSETGEIADFMNTVPKVVASRTLDQVGWHPPTIVNDDVAGEVRKLKEQPGGPVFVFGSATLTATLLAYGLVDELRIGVNPVILNEGVPLFKGGGGDRQELRLAESRVLGSGVVILHYRPV